MSTVNYVWLRDVPRSVAEKTGFPPPKYRRVYNLILDGLLDAEMINGRWRIREAQLPKVAELCRMPVRASSAA